MEKKAPLTQIFISLLILIIFSSTVSGTSNTTVPEVSFQWKTVDLSTNQSVNNGDIINDFGNYTLQANNGYFIYELPYKFNFLEREIVNISINTNGLIELLETGENCMVWNECKGWSTHYYEYYIGNFDAIFASNDNLRMDGPSEYLGVFNLGDKVVVEWKGVTWDDNQQFDPPPPIHFQVILYKDGTVKWNFNVMEWRKKYDHMFTGAYAKEEDIEFVAGYAIKRQTSFNYNFWNDTTPPSVTQNNMDGDYTNNLTPTFNATCTDIFSPLQKATLYINNTAYGDNSSSITSGDPFTITAISPLAVGYWEWTITIAHLTHQ
jgi:hypothetical protein